MTCYQPLNTFHSLLEIEEGQSGSIFVKNQVQPPDTDSKVIRDFTSDKFGALLLGSDLPLTLPPISSLWISTITSKVSTFPKNLTRGLHIVPGHDHRL